MGLFDRIGRIVRANVNDLVNKAEDPEKILDQAIIDMQNDLVELRQAVARAIASQKRTEQQYKKNLTEANNWQQRAQLALTKGDENLAREALVRKKTSADTANTLKRQLDQQVVQVETLKRNLITKENQISEAKMKKDMLKARIASAKANVQLQSTIENLGADNAMAAFERMEDKVLEIEAETNAVGELGGVGLEQQFAQLEGSNEVEDELAMMKMAIAAEAAPPSIAGAPPSQEALPAAEITKETPSSAAEPKSKVDAELDALRAEINQM